MKQLKLTDLEIIYDSLIEFKDEIIKEIKFDNDRGRNIEPKQKYLNNIIETTNKIWKQMEERNTNNKIEINIDRIHKKITIEIEYNNDFGTKSKKRLEAELVAYSISELYKVLYRYEKYCIDNNCEDEYYKFEEYIYDRYKLILDY
jgi:hypothetical protein